MEGEKMLTAMAYTTLKLHKSEYEDDDRAERVQPVSRTDTAMAAVAIPVTLPSTWLPPNWMAYIMQVGGCCGEKSKADFSLDTCTSIASARLHSCKTAL